MKEHNTNQEPFFLSDEERASMKMSFREYMEERPVRVHTRLLSPYFSTSFVRMPAYAFVALVFILTGTAYAAESSLPNDPLYAVKTRIIEPTFIQGTAFTKHSKARASSTLASRRLKEANTLVNRRQLDSQIAAYIQSELERHTNAVHTYVAEASQEGRLDDALEINTELETALEAHAEVLVSVNEDNGTTDDATNGLIADLKEDVVETANAGDRLESDTITSMNERTETYLRESKKEVEDALESLLDENVPLETNEDTDLLDEARSLLTEAQASYTLSNDATAQGNTKEAVEGVRDALRSARQAAILIDSYNDLSED